MYREQFKAELAKRGVPVDKYSNDSPNADHYYWNGADCSVICLIVYKDSALIPSPICAVQLFARQCARMIAYGNHSVEQAAEVVESIVKADWWKK